MNEKSYRFNTGDFQCIAVSDGFHTYAPPDFPPPNVLLFSNAPEEAAKLNLDRNDTIKPWSAWTSPYTCLVVNTGKHLVLVDTGAGNLASTTGKLMENLKAERIAPEDIDIVINTHGHPDHLGGNVDSNGKPAFPQARYVLSKVEWEFWMSGEAEKKLDSHSGPLLMKIARQNLLPIKDKIELVDQNDEIVPGIRAIPAPGHTPGHIALSIVSGNEQLLYISDVLLHPLHLEKSGWCCVFDVEHGNVESTRHKIIEKAAKEKALVMAFHFPFPGLGYIVRGEKKWKWEGTK